MGEASWPTAPTGGAAPDAQARCDRPAGTREYLLDAFSVADAYLFTVLSWAQATPVDLRPYPALGAYLLRLRARPSVKRALEIELPMYLRAKG